MQYASRLGGGDGRLHAVSHPYLVPTYHLAAPGSWPHVADKRNLNEVDLNRLIQTVLVRGVHSVITISVWTITYQCLLTNQQN